MCFNSNYFMRFLCILSVLIFPQLLYCQWEALVGSHQQKMENACKYTQAVAELMPDSLYNYSPVGEMMTFKEQLIHLSENLIWLSSTYLSENKKTFPYDKVQLQKAHASEIKQITNESCRFAILQLSQLDTLTMLKKFNFGKHGQLNKIQFLNLIQDHHSHHRGQLVVYLRMKGIIPPKYNGW